MIETARKKYPNFQVVATTLRNAKTATMNDWGAVCSFGDEFFSSQHAARTSRSSIASAAATRSRPG